MANIKPSPGPNQIGHLNPLQRGGQLPGIRPQVGLALALAAIAEPRRIGAGQSSHFGFLQGSVEVVEAFLRPRHGGDVLGAQVDGG